MNPEAGSDSNSNSSGGMDDDGWGSAEPPSAVPQATIERNERIQAMLEAGSAAGVSDDDVTDFILHMQQKNSRMMMEQQQVEEEYYSSDEENNKDDLEASYNKNNMALRRRHQEHSPDEYPPGEAYAGDEVGEEGDIPSFDPKDDDMLSNGRLCCIACVLIISMIAMSLLIILFIVFLDGEEGDNSKQKYGYVIPSAPSNLSQMCSLKSLETSDGMMACREPCREAACCWEIGESGLGLDPFCWDDNPVDCAPYQICINLLSAGQGQIASQPRPSDTSSYVAPAPADIDSCDPSIVASSVDELLLCEDACSHAPCCWKEGVKTCTEHPNCASYSRCDILNVDGPIAIAGAGNSPDDIPEPASDIAELCSEPANSLQMCAHYCSRGECCWKTDTTTTTSNGVTTTQTVTGTCTDHPVCEHYMPCTVLNDEDISSGTVAIPKAPEGLDFICSTSAEDCVQNCNEATCCWKTTTVTSTSGGLSVSENIEGICASQPECKDYEPCVVLQQGGVTNAVSIPPAPADLASVCASATDQCNVYCKEAPCCWEHVTVTSSNSQTGEKYTSTLEGSCSDQPSCDPYQPCSVLQSSSMPPTSKPTVEVPTAPTDLESSCNPPDANVLGALDYCTEVCFKATCCWKTETTTMTTSSGQSVTESIAGTCSQQLECLGYSPCSTLEDDLFSPHSPSVDTDPPASAPVTNPPASNGGDSAEFSEEEIYGACYNHNDLPGVKTLCEQVCENASCCYTSGTKCSDEFVCDNYWPCHKLLQDENGDGVASAVNTACDSSGGGFDFADCLELCGHSTCCFTNDVTKSCDEVKANIECPEYAGCESLYAGGGR